jgi:hypothetical protein
MGDCRQVSTHSEARPSMDASPLHAPAVLPLVMILWYIIQGVRVSSTASLNSVADVPPPSPGNRAAIFHPPSQSLNRLSNSVPLRTKQMLTQTWTLQGQDTKQFWYT